MARKSAALRNQQQEPPSLPEVLIPPSEAKENQKSAYWIELLGEPDQLKKAVETTDFFVLLLEFPEALWDRLSIYLYRLPDDAGLMLKNAEDKAHYIKVIRSPLTEDLVSKNWGGGKYQAWLKLDNKEVLRKHTFRIDGAPKLQPGQIVEMDGKQVPVGTAAPAPSTQGSDVAQAINATTEATRAGMDVLKKATESAMEINHELTRRDLGLTPGKEDSFQNKLLELLMAKVLAPPAATADPMTTALTLIDKLDSINARRNPQPEEKDPKDPPITEAMNLVEQFTGKPFSELIKGRSAAAATDATPSWVGPLVTVASRLVEQIPSIMQQSRATRDLEFRRAIYIRSLQPGQTPAGLPAELMPPAAPLPPATQQTQPQPTPSTDTPNAIDLGSLVNTIVQMIVHGFDKNPQLGYQTAAAIDFNFGGNIEYFGIEKMLSDEKEVAQFVAGHPLLAQRSSDARWKLFQEDFLNYTSDRWGEETDGEEKPGPQPVA